MTNTTDFDVIITGGSYAGLSAAMTLGRSLKKVLIIDSNLPCNRQTPHSHNFITQDGESPSMITEKAKSQVLKYDTVKFHEGIAIKGEKTEDGFIITTEKNESFTSKKLVFATGIKDLMPDVKGFSECWGISVVHCPYCHGYELRGNKTVIWANEERAYHLASLVNNLTSQITILTSGKSGFSKEQTDKLTKHSIKIIETGVKEINHVKGNVRNVVLEDGSSLEATAMYAAVPFIQHSDIPASLGCEITEQGYIKTDFFQKTTADGIYACGDNTSMMRSVANAVYSGNLTGAMVNKDLTEEGF